MTDKELDELLARLDDRAGTTTAIRFGSTLGEDFEDAAAAIRQLREGRGEAVACKHEPFEGFCVHCGVRFVNGRAFFPDDYASPHQAAPKDSVTVPDFLRGYNLLRLAAIEFVDKCDRGEARSKRSYKAFKDALAMLAAHEEQER